MRLSMLLAVSLFAVHPIGAQTPRLVRDINLVGFSNPGSGPAGFVQLGGFSYFVATNRGTGRELYRSSGIPATTTLVVDIDPGPSGGSPSNLTPLGSGMLFLATRSRAQALFHFDPATSTLTPLAATTPTSWIRRMGSVAFFRGAIGLDEELWLTDGTVAGTRRVADLNPTGSSSPQPLGVHNGVFYFSANDGQNGNELWRSDGTTAGTWMLKDMVPGSGHGFPAGFASLGNVFVFGSSIPFNPRIWVSDGTPGNTVQIASFASLFFRGGLGPFVPVGGRAYFMGVATATGLELWSTDGTAAGTKIVRDIVPGSGGAQPFGITAFGNLVLFSAVTPALGYELWRSDGTAAGTVPVADIVPGSGSSSPSWTTVVGNTAYLVATGSGVGSELWRSDGTAAGTRLVRDIEPGAKSSFPSSLAAIGNQLWFAATTSSGSEPWLTDALGTRQVQDLYPANPGSASSAPQSIVDLGGIALFAATDGLTGRELWRSDGTLLGTRLVTDILPGTAGSNPDELTVLGNRVYFAASSSAIDRELWVSDGTIGGTRELVDLHPTSLNPQSLVAVADKLFFTGLFGTGPQARIGVFRTDGTPTGTTLLTTVSAGQGQPGPQVLTAVGDTLFFRANDGTTGWEPWVSDGTAAGTRRLADINPGPIYSLPGEFIAYRGRCYFPATDGSNDTELYRSDGTTAGTARFVDLDPNGSSAPRFLTVANDTLFFVAFVGGVPRLCRSDGTPQGTRVVSTTISPRSLEPLHPLRSGVVFVGSDGEPWRSDGTAQGTFRLKDIDPVNQSSPREFVANGANSVWFSAYDGTDFELWFTDGTTAGTRRVADIYPGSNSSLPMELAFSNGRVLFSAQGGVEGRELWALDPDGFAHAMGQGRGDKLRTPAFFASEPKIGQPFSLWGTDATPNTQGFILASPLLIPAIQLAPGNFTYIDPIAFGVLRAFTPSASSWSWQFTMPNDPRLAGAEAALQAYFAPTAAPLGIDFTNAVHARIGR